VGESYLVPGREKGLRTVTPNVDLEGTRATPSGAVCLGFAGVLLRGRTAARSGGAPDLVCGRGGC
jgi:hypothetical protein